MTDTPKPAAESPRTIIERYMRDCEAKRDALNEIAPPEMTCSQLYFRVNLKGGQSRASVVLNHNRREIWHASQL